MKKNSLIVLISLLLIIFVCRSPNCQEITSSSIVGQIFGEQITEGEFNYYLGTSSMFSRSGKSDIERDEDMVRQDAWVNMIYLREAKKLGLEVSKEDLKKELIRLMDEKNIEYGTDAYYLWVTKVLKEDVNAFEKRIESLLLVNKFMSIKAQPEVSVTEEEMEQKFLNQYSSFESEYIAADNEESAFKLVEEFKKNPKTWKVKYDEGKVIGQKGAAWINMMSLEALIDLWKIPKEDAYRILSHKNGDFIAAKFFYDNAVFRLLNKKEADMSKYDDKKKEYYRDMMISGRKRKIVQDYFEDLFERADFKDFVAEKKLAEKKVELKKKSRIILGTNKGDIELDLYVEEAPLACENFIGLVEKGYYNEIIFHRVVKDFMIQGGDPTGTGQGGDSIWEKPFIDEVNDKLLFDKKGLLAMANSGPNTNKSQFFITVKETPWLNKKHTIFGEVISGYDIVEKIENTEVDGSNKPKEEQKIIKAYIKVNNDNKSEEGEKDDG